MKKLFLIAASMLIVITAMTQVELKNKRYKNRNKDRFSVKDNVVFFDGKALAKYQAKTYSLDNGELVEEYNLQMINNKVDNKQIIGDLIDFVSDRHKGAEVEVEVDANGSDFKL